MSKEIYFSPNDVGRFTFSNKDIAVWFCKKMGYDIGNLILDDDTMIKQYYEESLIRQKEELLYLLKERPEETKKMIDEVLDEMYKRK